MGSVAFFGGTMNNTQNLIYRFAHSDDAEQLSHIYKPYVENTAVSFEYVAPDAEEFRKRIEEKIKEYPFIVALIEDRIVGYCYASQFMPRPAYKHSVETTVYIDKDFHGKGIGRSLYFALERILELQNVISLNACIAFAHIPDVTLNNNSMMFHSRMGYRYVGRFNASGYKFGRFYDMIWMEKLITNPECPVGEFLPFGSVFDKAQVVLSDFNNVYNKTVN